MVCRGAPGPGASRLDPAGTFVGNAIQHPDATYQLRIDVSNYNVIRTLTIHEELGRGGRDSSKLQKTLRNRAGRGTLPDPTHSR